MNARLSAWLFLLRRFAGLSPRALWRMVRRRIAFRFDSRVFNMGGTRFSSLHILARLDADNFDAAFRPLAERPLFHRPDKDPTDSKDRITAAAEAVMAGDVEIFGTTHHIGAPPVDWRCDFRSGLTWPPAPAAKIRVNRLNEPCDIKVPWELSRLQWLFPLAQAWRLTRDDKYARRIRAVIEDWDGQNPALRGPNWVSAMEAGLRGVSLVWLACQCLDAPSWAPLKFRARLARILWLHGRFVSHNVEWADVNGNHVIACALGLTVLGGALPGPDGRRWTNQGWNIIAEELPRQTGGDGVSFEASTAYHRFVLEMILTAVMARRAQDLPPDSPPGARMPEITARAAAMAAFITHYLRSDGSAPAWGDDDSGRVLPFGPAPAADHAVIAAAAAFILKEEGAPVPACPAPACPVNAEALFWFCGAEVPGAAAEAPASASFKDAGVYILRAGDSHVFMDAGPVGMAGRGGHGHNDCLNVEIALCGAPLIIDPGTWTYTADAPARNRFGPVADGREINRFVHPRLLWMLHDDAKPIVKTFAPAPEGGGVITAGHTGYERLHPAVRPERTVRLDAARHAVQIIDDIALAGPCALSIRYMLHPDVTAEDLGGGRIRLKTLSAGGPAGAAAGAAGAFMLAWEGRGWAAAVGPARASPAYGVLAETSAVVFQRAGPGPAKLVLDIAPEPLANGAKAVNLEP
ncbi:MAG: heparinase II/III domain-containing protein [Rhodospirillales bacterium]